jgi:hypothetical protein
VFSVYLLINVHNHIVLALQPVWVFSLEANFVRFFFTLSEPWEWEAEPSLTDASRPHRVNQPVKPGRDGDPHPHLTALLALFGPLLAAVVCCAAAAMSSVF